MLAVPAAAKTSFRLASHVYMCSATPDPEVYESVAFLQSRAETKWSAFVPPTVSVQLNSFSLHPLLQKIKKQIYPHCETEEH